MACALHPPLGLAQDARKHRFGTPLHLDHHRHGHTRGINGIDPTGGQQVTHLDVGKTDIDSALKIINDALAA